jgi:hypothetical protein
MDKTVIIKGHQRSGNNYMIHLIGLNFFNNIYDTSDFSDKNDHCILNVMQQNVKYLYILRNKADTLKSVFNIKSIYGINESDYNYFYDTPYIKMYNPNLKNSQIYVTPLKTQEFECINNYFFCCIEKSPSQWYDFHVNHYRELSKNNPNMLIVSYDELINNFKSEMDKISIHLIGEVKETYQNINTKVGWFAKI